MGKINSSTLRRQSGNMPFCLKAVLYNMRTQHDDVMLNGLLEHKPLFPNYKQDKILMSH